MLVQNSTLKGKVSSIKLLSGEEIIARVVEYDKPANILEIKNPLAMVMMPNDDGVQGMVAFAPWMLGVPDDTNISINTSHVMAINEARPDAASQYSQAVGEDTQVATPKVAPQALGGRRGGRGR